MILKKCALTVSPESEFSLKTYANDIHQKCYKEKCTKISGHTCKRYLLLETCLSCQFTFARIYDLLLI